MRKQSFSGKRIKVFLDLFPLGIAKVEDAIVITRNEDDFLDPVIDMDGDGAQVEGTDGSATIVLKVDPSDTATIQRLEVMRQIKLPAATMTGRDLTTQNKAFKCSNVALKKYPAWTGGTRPPVLEYTFSAIRSEEIQDGPRILPV